MRAMPRFEYLMTVRAELKAPVEVGAVPSGNRQIFDVSGGSFEGPRLQGGVLPSGGDWMLFGSDGIGRLDVRGTLETDDGARIYMQYPGVLVVNAALAKALASGGETNYGDTYFMTQPRFETGDSRYAWLNAVVAIGQGRNLPGAVEYQVYQVQND